METTGRSGIRHPTARTQGWSQPAQRIRRGGPKYVSSGGSGFGEVSGFGSGFLYKGLEHVTIVQFDRGTLTGGSWVVIDISRVTVVITLTRGLITPEQAFGRA